MLDTKCALTRADTVAGVGVWQAEVVSVCAACDGCSFLSLVPPSRLRSMACTKVTGTQNFIN